MGPVEARHELLDPGAGREGQLGGDARGGHAGGQAQLGRRIDAAGIDLAVLSQEERVTISGGDLGDLLGQGGHHLGSADRGYALVAQGAAVGTAPRPDLAVGIQGQGVLGPGPDGLQGDGAQIGDEGGHADHRAVRVDPHLPGNVVAPGVEFAIGSQGQTVPGPGGHSRDVGG